MHFIHHFVQIILIVIILIHLNIVQEISYRLGHLATRPTQLTPLPNYYYPSTHFNTSLRTLGEPCLLLAWINPIKS